MQRLQTRMSDDEVAQRGKAWYESIRAKVETKANIGKMVIIDVNTGDYEIDELGLQASRYLQSTHPEAELYGIRIGYTSAEVLGGVLERTAL